MSLKHNQPKILDFPISKKIGPQKTAKNAFFWHFLPHFWDVTHIKRHPHPQIFCGIVVHDRTDVPQKIYSFPSRFKHKNFGLKWQKKHFLNFLSCSWGVIRGVFEPKFLGQQLKICVPTSPVSQLFLVADTQLFTLVKILK